MKNILIKRPYFVLLLPVFFVLHGYAVNSKYIEFVNLIPFLAQLLTGAALLYIICWAVLKNSIKAGLFVLFCLSFYFFFGAIFDFLKAYSPWRYMYKYSVLMIIFLVLAFLLFVKLRNMKKDPAKATLFFNLLFSILILVDLFNLVMEQPWKNAPIHTVLSKHSIQHSTSKPDIYLLVFDEYASNRSLQSVYGFDNSQLDSFLLQQGFHLIPKSTSNYPVTNISMASCLNLDYLNWVQPGMKLKQIDYQESNLQIRNSAVLEYLSDAGYKINNQSIFPLLQHPSTVSQIWLSQDVKLISEETLLGRICQQFDWHLNQYAILRKILPLTSLKDQVKNNDQCISGVMQAAKEKSDFPKFVYGHFLFPHFPFSKDKYGNMLPDSVIYDLHIGKRDPVPYYLDYVQYTNIELKKMISTIRQYNPEAVILFMSDHGYRSPAIKLQVEHNFYTQNAVYLPSGNYTGFHDSLSHVNQFRVLFNSLFEERLPMLKDSTIFIQ